MKLSTFTLALSASSAFALTIPKRQDNGISPEAKQLFTIELAPGETRQVTEEEKWALKKAGTKFMDITSYGELQSFSENRVDAAAAAVTFPSSVTLQTSVEPLLLKLDKANIQSKLERYVQFHNRYYKSSYGKQASEWLLGQVQDVIKASGSKLATARAFNHTWGQPSVIATLPGKSNNTIVIGAHLDSVNGDNPNNGRAPGADDDGSGTMTILEGLRVILTDQKVLNGEAPNTIEFHWYAAEEGGLLGSQAIFQDYKKRGAVVKAMLQQDMTGYVKKGSKESVGVITDFVDTGLTEFIKKVITAYCDIEYVSTKCGYACSDHASASKAGYPSSFVIEAAMENTSDVIHTDGDTISTVSFDHMLQHAKMTVGFGYELAFASGL